MKTNQNNKSIVNSYLRQVKAALLCQSSMKMAVLNEVENRIVELEKQHTVITMDNLYKEIGSPDEIAKGFEGEPEIGYLKKNTRKLSRTRIICLVLFVLVVLSAFATAVIIKSNETYHSEVVSHSSYTKEED